MAETRSSSDEKRTRKPSGPSGSTTPRLDVQSPVDAVPEKTRQQLLSNGHGQGDHRSQQPSRRNSRRSANGPSSRPQSPYNTNDKANGAPVPGKRRTSGTTRVCGKCHLGMTGQFVRALEDTFHLECFTCHDCGTIVASKFFPVPDQGPGQYPLCETDYFRRLDLLCFSCGGALRGSYITALDRKYHIEHFTCSVCPTVFGAQDSYYEHEGSVYCHYHYSTRFAQRCNGCQTAILKQFVEIFRNGQNQHWHPECYMIHKYWNVRLHAPGQPVVGATGEEQGATEAERTLVRTEEERVEDKVLNIWKTLSVFEEKSAACISDMLLHVSNGAYVDGVMAAKKLILHVELLFTAADNLDRSFTKHMDKGLAYSREAKLLCKKVVAFFTLLAKSQETGVRRLGVTQELLSLVTGLAHYLKLLIRICLQGALKLERETGQEDGLRQFLEEISSLEIRLIEENFPDSAAEIRAYCDTSADTCPVCDKPVEDKCFRYRKRVLHTSCLACQACKRPLEAEPDDARWSEQSQRVFDSKCVRHSTAIGDGESGFVQVSRLQQYTFLLKVAHARMLATLKTSTALPHTSDDPNLSNYDSSQGHRLPADGNRLGEPPLLRSNTRSKSYAGTSNKNVSDEAESSYEQTLGDIRRLRSTRMDKSLQQTRTSKMVGGPGGGHFRTGSSDEATTRRSDGSFQAAQDKDPTGQTMSQLTFGNQDSITLDDIPRIVAAEQAKEQRPNAYKHARGNLLRHEPQPKLMDAYQRQVSGGPDLNRLVDHSISRPKKYFSELSALEYLIVRHVAVLSMQPILDGMFTQEELLDLIENRKPTFWDKFGKAFKSGQKKKGVFGVALEQLVERASVESSDGVGPGTLRVPAILNDSLTAMRTMDMSVEGVFRKNGNIKRLRELADEIDAKGGEGVDLNRENPVQVAALLKKFLRELPEPILTFKLHKLFIVSHTIEDDAARMRLLHLTCCLLPKAHRDAMEVLFSFLKWAASFSHIDEESGSKMDVHNLATVIAPNILYNKNDPFGTTESFHAIEAVASMVEGVEMMCEVPEDLQSILNDSTLFSGSADITTKEILRRYGDTIGSRLIATNNSSTSPTQQQYEQSAFKPTSTSSSQSTGVAHSTIPSVVHRSSEALNPLQAWQNDGTTSTTTARSGGGQANCHHLGTGLGLGFATAPPSSSSPAQQQPQQQPQRLQLANTSPTTAYDLGPPSAPYVTEQHTAGRGSSSRDASPRRAGGSSSSPHRGGVAAAAAAAKRNSIVKI